MERLRRFKRFDADDLAHEASLQAQLGRPSNARDAIDKAIAMTLRDKDFYTTRRRFASPSNQSAKGDNLAFSRDLHDRARFLAQSGDNGAALGSYVEALHALPKHSDEGDGKIEVGSLLHDFSEFLVSQYGRDAAIAWWGAFDQNPIASGEEKRLGAAEAQRLAAKP